MIPRIDPLSVPPEFHCLLSQCAGLAATLDVARNRRLAALLGRPHASFRFLADLIDGIGPLAADCHRALVGALGVVHD